MSNVMKKNIRIPSILSFIVIGVIIAMSSAYLFVKVKEVERDYEIWMTELIRKRKEMLLEFNDKWYKSMMVIVDLIEPEFLMVPPAKLKLEISLMHSKKRGDIITAFEGEIVILHHTLIERVRATKEISLKLLEESYNDWLLLMDKINPAGFKKSPEAVKQKLLMEEYYLSSRREIIEEHERFEKSLAEYRFKINMGKYFAIVGLVVGVAMIIGTTVYVLLKREGKSLG